MPVHYGALCHASRPPSSPASLAEEQEALRVGWLMGETLAWSSGSRRSGGAAPMSGKRCLNLSSSAQGVAGQGVGTRFHPKQELAPNIVSPARA